MQRHRPFADRRGIHGVGHEPILEVAARGQVFAGGQGMTSAAVLARAQPMQARQPFAAPFPRFVLP